MRTCTWAAPKAHSSSRKLRWARGGAEAASSRSAVGGSSVRGVAPSAGAPAQGARGPLIARCRERASPRVAAASWAPTCRRSSTRLEPGAQLWLIRTHSGSLAAVSSTGCACGRGGCGGSEQPKGWRSHGAPSSARRPASARAASSVRRSAASEGVPPAGRKNAGDGSVAGGGGGAGTSSWSGYPLSSSARTRSAWSAISASSARGDSIARAAGASARGRSALRSA